MSLYPCSVCKKRTAEKLSSVTWAWNRIDGERVAWRQRLCVACFATRVLAMPMLTPEQPLTCPGCGAGTADDMDPMFCTAFVPGGGRLDFEWPTCAGCAVAMRQNGEDGGERLENRQGPFGGPGPGPRTDTGSVPGHQTWAGLGIFRKDSER